MNPINLPAADVTPYCGPLAAPGALLTTWNLDPYLLAVLTALAAGLFWLRTRQGWDIQRSTALWMALGGLFVAFVSPLCAATVALFAARAGHHILLVSLVAPALALALPWRAVSSGVGLALTSGALILWHLPAVYALAWNSAAIYWVMQGALLLPGWMFWSAVLAPTDRADRLFANAFLVGGLAGVMGLIGSVLTFAPRALYPQHLVGTDAYGIGLLADQQLSGLIMWVPGFLPIAALAFWMLQRGWKKGFAA